MPDARDAQLIAELRMAHNHADLRLYETYTDTHPTHGILTDERELPNELARLISLAESALSARAEALLEAAEIATQYASDIDDGDYTGIGSDIAADIASAILARIQEPTK